MRTKYSPTPWVVLEPYTDRAVFPIGYLEADHAGSYKSYHIIGEFNSQGGTPEECSANAMLAAAAPDLLEACKTMLRVREQLAAAYGNKTVGADIVAARAAIAKTLGPVPI